MKIARTLIAANCLIFLVAFFNVLKWMLSDRGVNYLSMLSDFSRNIFYSLLIISVFYSAFICCLLLNFKRRGTALIVSWDIFLGLFILAPWLWGYAMLKYNYGMDAVFDVTSADSLLKGFLGISLILFGLAFKRKKIAIFFSS